MSKEKALKKFRTLILLACFLSILAVASDSRNSHVKALTHPICATLSAETVLLGGTVDYCGASGTLGADLQLDMQSSFFTAVPAQTFAVFSADLLGQEADIQTTFASGAWVTTVQLNE